MSHSNAAKDRVARLLRLVAREEDHLLAVRGRLLGDAFAVDEQRVVALLADELGVDRLESFGAKFGRMQDTLADKLIPAVMLAAGEKVGAVIDNLGRMERLGLIADADAWLQMRGLRNRLIHEYIDRPNDLAAALEAAARFVDRMHADFAIIRDYAQKHLGIAT